MAFGTIGEAFIKVRPDFSTFSASLSTGATAAIHEAGLKLANTAEEAGKALLRKFALPLGVAITANITQWQNLDASIRETLTLFGAGGTSVIDKQFEEMRVGIRGVSKEVGVLEQNIADGLYQAISAGVPRANVFEFLETAQKAAIAGASDTLTVVDGLTTATNAFAASNLTAQEAADIMFRGVARGKTTISELASDMARVAPLFATAGGEFEEFIAIVAAMTLQGTKTSEAFSFLRAAMTGILRPTELLNQVWEQLGTGTAEAAIEMFGVQATMQAVADAAGGSASKLFELVGSSEAVNAILQVTGDNASTFASVLQSTSTAAGATDQAFSTMQDGVGRAFGRMTAAFDRLGNSGGRLVSGFVVPVVDAFGNAISTFADFTDEVANLVQPLTDIWSSFVSSVLDNPVFRVLVTGIGAAVAGVTVLGTSMGALLITMSLFLKTWIAISAALTKLALAKIGANFLITGGAVAKLSERLLKGGAAAQFMGARLAVASGGLQRFGSFLGRLAGSGGTLALVTLSIGALVGAVLHFNRESRRAQEAAQFLTRGADSLADSLGLTVQKMNQFEMSDDFKELVRRGAVTIDIDFIAQNRDVIEGLTHTMETLGLDTAQEQLFRIAVRWTQQGNSPEEAFLAAQQFVQRGGLTIPITFDVEDLEDPGSRTAQGVIANARALTQLIGPFFSDQLKGDLKQVGEEIGVLLLNPETFEQGRRGLLELGAEYEKFGLQGRQAFDHIVTGLIKFLEGDRKLGFRLHGLQTADNALGQLGDKLPEWQVLAVRAMQFASQGFVGFAQEAVPAVNEVEDELAGLTSVWENLMTASPFRGSEFAEGLLDFVDMDFQGIWADQAAAIADFEARTREAFDAGRGHIEQRIEEIRQGFLDQLPLLRTYSGQVEQTFKDWLEGQNLFQEQMRTWRDNSARILSSLPEEVASRIQQEPISFRAWLASLGDTELDRAIAELTESYGLVSEAADTEIKDKLPAIIQEANDLVNEKYATMESEAAAAGWDIAMAFQSNFAEGWRQFQRWLGGLVIQLPGVNPPTLPPGFTGRSDQPAPHITVVNNNPVTPDLETATINSIREARLISLLDGGPRS